MEGWRGLRWSVGIVYERYSGQNWFLLQPPGKSFMARCFPCEAAEVWSCREFLGLKMGHYYDYNGDMDSPSVHTLCKRKDGGGTR